MAILAQLVDAKELQSMTAEQLRNMILRLDEQIKLASSGEKILVSLEATVVGVQNDRPAGETDFKLQSAK